MSTNILNLKLHKQYSRCVKSLCLKNSDLENKGINYIDDFLIYIHKCHSSIRDKVNKGISAKKSKNKYEKRFDEFNFYMIINLDLSCVIGVDLIQSSSKKMNDTLLKSAYQNREGFVYFLVSDYGYKIGCTKDITRRFKELKTLMPFELKLHSYVKIIDFNYLENLFHNTFEDKRLNGEWFDLNDDDFNVIDEICRLHNVVRIKNK